MKLLFLLSLLLVAACYAAEREGSCPEPSGMFGICQFREENCLDDDECVKGQKCCPEQCGSICKDIVKEEIVHAGTCPQPTSEFGICMIRDDSCTSDGECAKDEKCCPEGCNSVCKKAL